MDEDSEDVFSKVSLGRNLVDYHSVAGNISKKNQQSLGNHFPKVVQCTETL